MAHTVQESPEKIPGPLTLHGLSVEGVNQCVHCGLCLASCPTFSELGTEMDSPRGRIFLIKSLAEGRIALTDSVADHLSLCLDCRACETVCPAGVPYGGLIEAAKAEMEHRRPGSPARRLFRWLNFGLLLGHPRLLGLAAAGLRLYQTCGLQFLVRASGIVRVLPRTLRAWESLLPPLPSRAERAPLPRLVTAEGPRRARVALLTGCVQAVVFGAHNRATARVLAKNGCDVVVPEGQGCCGALNAHGGDHARALISDLVVYHPEKRQQGLRDGTLGQLFKDEIEKSWQEYVEQVGADLAKTTPFWTEALNEILAGGNKLF